MHLKSKISNKKPKPLVSKVENNATLEIPTDWASRGIIYHIKLGVSIIFIQQIFQQYRIYRIEKSLMSLIEDNGTNIEYGSVPYWESLYHLRESYTKKISGGSCRRSVWTNDVSLVDNTGIVEWSITSDKRIWVSVKPIPTILKQITVLKMFPFDYHGCEYSWTLL